MAVLSDEINDILAWVAAGYDPHPVIPPGVEIHAASKIEASDRGKAPGVIKEGTDTWVGVHWLRPWVERARLQRGDLWGASFRAGNGGVRTGAGVVSIDIDALRKDIAEKLRALALRVCGWAPTRVGQAPKCLLVYAAARDELVQPTRVFRWGKPGEKETVGVEILGAGRQFVVKGIHPKTGMPYVWDCDPLAAAEMLVPLGNEGVRAFIDGMREIMGAEGYSLLSVGAGGGRGGAGLTPPKQETLLAEDWSVLASAVACIPNPPDTAREDYVALGHALKAAGGQRHAGDAFLLWWEWAEKWEPDDPARANTIESCEADWARMKGPFRVGADYVYEMAASHGWSKLPLLRAAFGADPLPEGEVEEPGPPLVGKRPAEKPAAKPKEDGPKAEKPRKERRPPATPEERAMAADLASDVTVVENFDAECGDDLLYLTDTRAWRCYDGGIWRPYAPEEVQSRLVDFVKGYAPRHFPPGDKENDRLRDRLTSGSRIGGYLKLAPSIVGRRTTLDHLGGRADVLVTPEGVIELREELPTREWSPGDLSLARTAVAPAPRGSKGPPLFLETLGYACAGVRGGVDYVQLCLGNMLLGNPAQIVLILWGRGGNGKSTALEAVKAALGTGATGYATSSVLEMWQKSIDFAVVQLAGKRAAIAAEFSPDLGWNESLVKAVSGGDTIQARNLFEGFTEQRTACMPCFAFNDPPRFKSLNEAMTRRLVVVAGGLLPGADNLHGTIVRKDTGAKDRILATELPLVLRWMLDGVERILDGESVLDRPDDVQRGLEMLIGEQDRVLGFIASHFIRTTSPDDRVPLADCVEILRLQIQRDEDEDTQRRLLPFLDSRTFAQRARMAGYETARGTNGVVVFRGVKLRGRLTDEKAGAKGQAVIDLEAARREQRRREWGM